jgi:hypothetical protein
MIFSIPDDASGLPAALAEKRAAAGTLAYLCTGMTCSAPITELREIARELASPVASRTA